MKMDYSEIETMTKLILTSTLQFCVLFSYNLCACHMTACHYIQALFHSGCAPCTADIKHDFRLLPQTVDETCTVLGYHTVSSGNL